MNAMPDQNQQFIPIYQRLFQYYQEKIIQQELTPGSRIDSIHEIQKNHDVSRETAKLVLKKLSEAGLILQKAGKGSFVVDLGPCQLTWGIIVPFFSTQIEELINCLRLEAKQRGRQLAHFLDYNEWREEIRLVGTMIRQRYEAVLVVPTYYDERKTAAFYNRLKTSGTTITLIDHTLVGSAFPYVIQSYDLGVKRAVDYLLVKCQGTLAFVKNSVWLKQNTVQAVMKETFENIVTKNDPHRKTVIIEDVYALTPEFIQQQKLEGFFCCDDIDAIRIIGRLKAWGITVPEQAIIVSYGNTDLAQYFTPPITAIDPHYSEMVRITAEIIDRHQQGEDVSLYQYVLQPDLIIRAT